MKFKGVGGIANLGAMAVIYSISTWCKIPLNRWVVFSQINRCKT